MIPAAFTSRFATSKRLARWVVPALAMALFALPAWSKPAAKPSPLKGKRIVLDPGHGTIDYEGRIINSGRISGKNLIEYRLTMRITDKLGDMLRKEGAEVIFTRTFDDYWRVSYDVVEDNKARAFFANEVKADVYVSVHCDWHPSRRIKGVTTLYAKPDSHRLAATIQRTLVRDLRANDRKLIYDRYTVLENTDMPSVIVETGFLSNPKESRKLVQADYQRKVAASITKALRRYFN